MATLSKSLDKKVAGVAGGFAEYFEMDKTLVRAIWLVACIVMPPMLLAYLILAIVMPNSSSRFDPIEVKPVSHEKTESSRQEQPRSHRRLVRSHDRWIAGVAGGVAEYFDLDPVLIRALFLMGLFVGGGLLLYLILWIVMPRPAYQYP